MIERQKNVRMVAAALLATGALALAGCGGGGGDGGPSNIGGNGGGNGGGTSGGTVPATALQNSDGFIAYVKQVVANQFDTSEPIELGNVVAPKNDTAEAVGI